MTNQDPREVWDRRFAQIRSGELAVHYEPWLDRWRAVLRASAGVPILDLGCGCGHDSRYLLDRGFRVIATDSSPAAMPIVREIAPGAELVRTDLRQGVPFASRAFQVIVANLSLHYCNWARTVSLVEEIRQLLRPGGSLLVCLNSIDDTNYGAVGHPEIEANYFLVRGVAKRFFDHPSILGLFSTGWRVHEIEEMVVHCYGSPKVIWEVNVGRARREGV